MSERRNTSNGADEHDSANSTPTRTKGIRSRTPLAAIAAALIVALLGAGLFGVLESHARHPGGTISKTNQTHTGTAPVLSLDPNVKVDPKTGYPPNTIFSSIQMLSANDGWAVGGWNQDTNSNNNKNGVVIAHYADGAWTLIFDDESGYSLNSVSLDSPDDGWAVGDFGALLHYSAGKWRAVSAPNISFYLSLIKVQMFSETEGWALASNGQVSNVQGSSYKFLHYLNGSWTVMPTPLTGLKDLSLDSASHGWAVGSDAHTQLAQYVNGQWQTFSQAPSEEFLSVSSLSPTDAWATGYPIVCSCQSAPTSSASRTNATSLQGALALNRPMNGMVGMNILHFDGVRWSRVPLNVPAYDNFGFITMLSANEGWALGVSVPPPNGPGYTLALHYQNGVWQVTNLHLEGQINAASFTSANDGWAVGGDDTGAPGSGGAPLFLHYHNGAWSVYHS